MCFIIVRTTFHFIFGTKRETKYVDILGGYDVYEEAENAINKYLEIYPSKSPSYKYDYRFIGIDKDGDVLIKEKFKKEGYTLSPYQNHHRNFERVFIFDKVIDGTDQVIGKKRTVFNIFELGEMCQEKMVGETFVYDGKANPRIHAHFSFNPVFEVAK